MQYGGGDEILGGCRARWRVGRFRVRDVSRVHGYMCVGVPGSGFKKSYFFPRLLYAVA